MADKPTGASTTGLIICGRSSYYPHERVSVIDTLPSRAKQSFRDECDINNIMKKFAAGELIDHVNKHQGRYEELPSNLDYHEALNMVSDAQDSFQSLSAEIRSMFHNDPVEFLEFVADPENAEEMIDLGLATARQQADPPASGTPDSDELPDTPPASEKEPSDAT